MTKLRFYDDQYETECTSVITSVQEEKGRYLVVLDETIFYPEGGGQPADRGWINDIPVIHVEKRDGVVLHHLGKAPEGEKAVCRLDWDHRFDYMQQHTGQHILSGVMFRDSGLNTVAVHQGEEYTTIEIDTDSVSDADIRMIEDQAMAMIRRNLPVQTTWVREHETGGLDLRRKPKVSGNIRIVSIEEYDSVACGGVHTASTAEVDMIKHVQTEKIRGRVRLYWKIGYRAYEDYRIKNEIISGLIEQFSARVPDLGERITATVDELTTLRRETSVLEGRLAECMARQVLTDGDVVGSGSGSVRFLVQETEAEGKDFLKKMAEGLPQDRRWLFCGINNLENSFQWLIAASDSLHFDFNAHRQELMEPVGGKGGGRPSVWQGVGSRAEGIGDMVLRLREILEAGYIS